MLVTDKFLKLLGFRGLERRVERVFALSAGVVCVFSLQPQANAQGLPSSPSRAACETELKKQFAVLSSLYETKKISPQEINRAFVETNCRANTSSQLNATKGESAERKNRDFALSKDSIGNMRVGACENSYFVIGNDFETLGRKYLAYCEQIDAAGKKLEDCAKKSSGKDESVISCITQLETVESEVKSKFTEISNFIDEGNRKLDREQNDNEEVIKKYELDRNQLATDPNITANQLNAAAGFSSIEEYKKGFAPEARAGKDGVDKDEGDLIEEQRLAKNNIEAYQKKLAEFKVGKHAISDELAAQQEKLRKLKSGLSSQGFGQYAAPAAAAASAGSGLLKSGASAASAGVSGSAVAAAALPAAAAVLSASNRNSSGASGASPKLPSTAEKPAEVAAATLTSSDRGPAATGKDDSLKSAEKSAENPAATTSSNPAFTGSFFASGSSQAGSLKRGGKANNAGETAAAPGNYANTGTEIGGGGPSFGSRPSSSPSPGGDVTNLLGQMKSLFNFDDPAGGGGSNPNAAFGGGIPSAGGATFPGEAGAEMAADGTMPTDPDAVVGAATPEGEEVQGSDLGRISDSLFVRVHKRHKRCVERGLLATMQGGLRQ